MFIYGQCVIDLMGNRIIQMTLKEKYSLAEPVYFWTELKKCPAFLVKLSSHYLKWPV